MLLELGSGGVAVKVGAKSGGWQQGNLAVEQVNGSFFCRHQNRRCVCRCICVCVRVYKLYVDLMIYRCGLTHTYIHTLLHSSAVVSQSSNSRVVAAERVLVAQSVVVMLLLLLFQLLFQLLFLFERWLHVVGLLANVRYFCQHKLTHTQTHTQYSGVKEVEKIYTHTQA